MVKDLTGAQIKVTLKRAKQLFSSAESGDGDRGYLTEKLFENLNHRLITTTQKTSMVMMYVYINIGLNISDKY